MEISTSAPRHRPHATTGSVVTWLVILSVVHQITLGPVAFLQGRGVLSADTVDYLYRPEIWMIATFGRSENPVRRFLTQPYDHYVTSCFYAGERHANP